MSGREFEIIKQYFTDFVTFESGHVVLGPGDDCAILDIPAGQSLCISTDTLVEGVHFPEGAPGHIVAHRSLCANLSDLAAMGATPFSFTLALTFPKEDSKWLEAFAATLSSLVRKYEIPLVGGNLARGPLSVTPTVLGLLPEGKGLKRSSARKGDDIYVSGTLGDAGCGLGLAQQDVREGYLVDRYYYPSPRLALGKALLDVASAAIDISDGLVADLGHMSEASGVQARIDAGLIPMSNALTAEVSAEAALHLALTAGDDYELCFCASTSKRGEIEAIGNRVGVPVTRIGMIADGSGVIVSDASGKVMDVQVEGYQHFHAT